MTARLRDSAAMLDAVHGPEPSSPYAAPPPERPFIEEVGRDPGRLRIAFTDKSPYGEAIDPALRNVIVGVQATERELQSVLERHGISRVEALGKPFNAEFHQAMMEIEDPTVQDGIDDVEP